MRISADILNRRLDFAAPPVLGETSLPVTIVRGDDDAFASAGTGAYRFTISYKSTNIAACSLSASADNKTLTGTLSLNTTEAQAVFDAGGRAASLECIASLKLLNVSGDVLRSLATSPCTVESIADDGGDVTDVTISQSGSTAITIGASTLAVTFATAFASAPTIVISQVQKPASDSDDLGSITISAQTVSGFTATFTAAAPTSGYKLNWYARA